MNKPPPTERLDWISFECFLTHYDVTRVERETAEYIIIKDHTAQSLGIILLLKYMLRIKGTSIHSCGVGRLTHFL